MVAASGRRYGMERFSCFSSFSKRTVTTKRSEWEVHCDSLSVVDLATVPRVILTDWSKASCTNDELDYWSKDKDAIFVPD